MYFYYNFIIVKIHLGNFHRHIKNNCSINVNKLNLKFLKIHISLYEKLKFFNYKRNLINIKKYCNI